MSIPATVVDEMELWQAAAQLGLYDPPPDDPLEPPGRAPQRLRSDRAPRRRKRDLIAERMAYARGEGPKPEPDPVDPSALAALGVPLIGGTPDAGRTV